MAGGLRANCRAIMRLFGKGAIGIIGGLCGGDYRRLCGTLEHSEVRRGEIC